MTAARWRVRERGAAAAAALHAMLLAMALGLAAVAPAEAQPSAGSRVAVSVGPEWLGRADLGGETAQLTGNGAAGPYTLFRTETELTGGVGPAASVAVRLAGQLWAEVAGRYHSTRLETRVSGDVEAEDVTVRSGLQQLQVEVGALWSPDRLRVASRLQVYGSGGGGFLRQLHGSNTLAENGRSFYAGGGVILNLPRRAAGTFKQPGIRFDVRAHWLQDGVAPSGGLHAAPAAWLALFLRF